MTLVPKKGDPVEELWGDTQEVDLGFSMGRAVPAHL